MMTADQGDFLIRQVALAGRGDDDAFRWLEGRMGRLLRHAVRNYAPTPMEYPDRWQIARIALFHACQLYDCRKGGWFTEFLTLALKHAYTSERRRCSYRMGRAQFVSYEYLEIECGEDGVPDPGPDRFSRILTSQLLAALYRACPPDARVCVRLRSIAQGITIENALGQSRMSRRAVQMAFLRWRRNLRKRVPHLFEEG